MMPRNISQNLNFYRSTLTPEESDQINPTCFDAVIAGLDPLIVPTTNALINGVLRPEGSNIIEYFARYSGFLHEKAAFGATILSAADNVTRSLSIVRCVDPKDQNLNIQNTVTWNQEKDGMLTFPTITLPKQDKPVLFDWHKFVAAGFETEDEKHELADLYKDQIPAIISQMGPLGFSQIRTEVGPYDRDHLATMVSILYGATGHAIILGKLRDVRG
jgi:hypothetical protein